MQNKKILFLGFLIFGLILAFNANAQAVCPICVVAIGAGLGLSRWLGVDDLVSSVWIGAFLLTLVIWTIHWLKKKNWDGLWYRSLPTEGTPLPKWALNS